MIRFFDHGTGSGAGAVDYLIRSTDPISKEPRQPEPKVLKFGNASAIAKTIDQLKFKHKYRSGVLSFAPDDAPTEQQQQQLMDDFEAIAFAGIEKHNRNILWVRHQHTANNRIELHFLTPRVELSTGKSLNIAPPGWKGYFYPWQRKWNRVQGWADPSDPARARVKSPGHTAFEAKRKAARGEELPADTRTRATAAVEEAIARRVVKDRSGVLKALQDNGFEVIRATNKSITIKNQEWQGDPEASRAKVRLKSQVFYKDWKLENQLNPPTINDGEITKLNVEVEQRVRKRREFNRQLYRQSFQDSNEQPIKTNPGDYLGLSNFLEASLGDRAITSPKAIALEEKRRQELQAFKSRIRLVDYAIAQGFKIDEKASSTNSVILRRETGEKIVVRPATDGHDVYFSPDNSLKSGTVIDFVQQYHQINLGQARKILREFLRTGDRVSRRKKFNIILPDHLSLKAKQNKRQKKPKSFDISGLRVLKSNSYLEDDRGISSQIIQSDRFEGQIQIDERNNVIFPNRDGENITGYELRNFNFKGFAAGGKKSLWRSNQKQNDRLLVITESPIDALSYHQLKGDNSTRYIATGGTFSQAQAELIKAEIEAIFQQDGSVIIATDNDEAGDKLAEGIAKLSRSKPFFYRRRLKPKLKDWNEDLISLRNQINNKITDNKKAKAKRNQLEI